jgi:hypothetical protein
VFVLTDVAIAAQFCIPESEACFNPSVYERKPTFFSFILTGGDGAHAYGFALHSFEEYSTDGGWDLVTHAALTRT